MSQDHSRKQFLSKLLGLSAGAVLASKLAARPAGNFPALPVAPAPVQVRPETRAVARRDGSA